MANRTQKNDEDEQENVHQRELETLEDVHKLTCSHQPNPWANLSKQISRDSSPARLPKPCLCQRRMPEDHGHFYDELGLCS